MANLPISMTQTHPTLKFAWSQVVSGRVVQHNRSIDPSLERAIERMVTINTTLISENVALHQQVNGLLDRIAKLEADVRLSKAAEIGDGVKPTTEADARHPAATNSPANTQVKLKGKR